MKKRNATNKTTGVKHLLHNTFKYKKLIVFCFIIKRFCTYFFYQTSRKQKPEL